MGKVEMEPKEIQRKSAVEAYPSEQSIFPVRDIMISFVVDNLWVEMDQNRNVNISQKVVDDKDSHIQNHIFNCGGSNGVKAIVLQLESVTYSSDWVMATS